MASTSAMTWLSLPPWEAALANWPRHYCNTNHSLALSGLQSIMMLGRKELLTLLIHVILPKLCKSPRHIF